MFQCHIPNFLVPQKSAGISRGRLYNRSKAERDWLVEYMRPLALNPILKEPVTLSLTFYFAIPKNTNSKTRKLMMEGHIRPDIRPDNSNLAYLVENALQGIAYDDDKRVCENIYSKFYGENDATVIKVTPIFQRQM